MREQIEALERCLARLESVETCGGRQPCHVCDGQLFAVKEDLRALLAAERETPAEVQDAVVEEMDKWVFVVGQVTARAEEAEARLRAVTEERDRLREALSTLQQRYQHEAVTMDAEAEDRSTPMARAGALAFAAEARELVAFIAAALAPTGQTTKET